MIIDLTYQEIKALAVKGPFTWKGKSLAIDLFSRAQVRLIAIQEGQTWTLKGILIFKGEETPLELCEALGDDTPLPYIKGPVLRFIETDLPNKLLHQLPLKTDEAYIRKLLDQDIAIELKGELTAFQPLPVLVLKDRTGAFANLWIQYGNERLPFQNKAAEQLWEKDLLETDYIRKKVDTTDYYCPMDKVSKSLTFLLEIGWTILDAKGQQILRVTSQHLQATENDNSILIQGKLQYNDHDADIQNVLGSFNRRERFIQLDNGAVGLLPESFKFSNEVEVVSGGLRMKRSQLSLLKDFDVELEPSLANLQERLNNFSGIEESPPSSSFNGTLRPYQQLGVNWLQFLSTFGFSGILADDMGLGKTVQVIAFLSRLPKDNRTLIVVPTSLLFNWKKELEQFLSDYPACIYHGTERQLPENGIVLTTYAIARLDSFHHSNWDLLILDEAQNIKNASTQNAKAVCRIPARHRICLSGTPVENHPQDLWSLFHFLMPDLLGDLSSFDASIKAAAADSRHLKQIQKKVKPFILRRKKEDVAKDLPEKIEQIVWIEMGAEQRQAYENFLAGAKKIHLADGKKSKMEIFEALLRLRQICCHPLLLDQGTESAKLDALLLDLETCLSEGRKAIVYSQFTSMLKLIGRELTKRGWNYAYLDGSTTLRDAEVAKFQTDANIPFFLISLKAGGVGLNLTAADYVMLYDPWWNTAAENQAIDRAHRIGRKDTVIAKRYVMIESIEEKMLKLKEAKASWAEGLLEDELDPSTLSLEDLEYLLTHN